MNHWWSYVTKVTGSVVQYECDNNVHIIKNTRWLGLVSRNVPLSAFNNIRLMVSWYEFDNMQMIL